MKRVWIRLLGKNCRPVVWFERSADRLHIVLEIQYKHVALVWVRTIDARQRLDRLDPRKRLVDIHRVQKRLIVACLELIGADEEAIRVLGDVVGDIPRPKSVERRFGHFRPTVFVLA